MEDKTAMLSMNEAVKKQKIQKMNVGEMRMLGWMSGNTLEVE